MHDDGMVSPVSNCVEFEKMHILRTIWCTVGPCSMSRRDPSRSRKGGNHSGPATSHIGHATQIHIGTYWILSKIHKRVHGDKCPNGEAAEKGHQI